MNDIEVPRTDAHALHALLAAVASAPLGGGLHAAWAQVLGADLGSADFSKRHSEVVGLFSRSVSQIAMLPPRSRVTYEKWGTIWWRALVAPDVKWDQQLAAPIIDEVHLSLLQALGDVVEASFGGSPVSPGGRFITELQQSVEDWLSEMNADPAILPDNAIRLSLVEDLRHILWLIEHRSVFGDASIARAAQATVGAVALASPHVPKEKRPSWRKRAVALAGVIAIFNGIVSGTQTAIESTDTAVVAAIDAGQEVIGALLDE